MPAVHPRARVRLWAVAVALSVTSTILVGAPAGAALAAPAPAAQPAASTSATALHAAAAATVTATQVSFAKPKAKPAAHKKAKPAHKKAKPAHKKAVHKKKPVHKKAAHKKAKKKATKLAFGVRVVRDASVYRGTPYQWGATGPSRFDCSGFTRFIFAKFGISLPHSSAGQYSAVHHVANRNKKIGDLIFFHSGGGHVYHVGIYAGNDRIWAATHTGDFVRLEGMWNASYYVGRIGA